MSLKKLRESILAEDTDTDSAVGASTKVNVASEMPQKNDNALKEDSDSDDSDSMDEDEDSDSDESVSEGLTAKQKKLPPGLQKAILKKMKKEDADSDSDTEDSMNETDSDDSDSDETVSEKKKN